MSDTQAVIGVILIYVITFLTFSYSKHQEKGHSDVHFAHLAIIKIGAALTDIFTDIFLILYLHNEQPSLSELKWALIISVMTAFAIGMVCTFTNSQFFVGFCLLDLCGLHNSHQFERERIPRILG